MTKAVDDGCRLDLELHDALAGHQFFVLYQPKVNLENGAVTGAEALLRWHHPSGKVLSPGEFVPRLEASGLITQVGRWVLETACQAGADWQSQGHRMFVSVNVSAKQLQRDGFVDDVRYAVLTSGLDPSMLVLELTETALMGGDHATLSRLAKLKALGVRLAIDDFGTGFSSFAYLQQFPIDVLKIDQCFVSRLTGSPTMQAIVEVLVQLGQALGLEVIAEGIETIEQNDVLAALGIVEGQGYLFSYPVEQTDMMALLERGRTGELSVGVRR
ncbi:MAG TPA: EAL domain-containing protein [Acidimicrobiales bacterium]|jgi:EAL domain-containing protein (putative c-di-GMP-specific phosphodiesterase class I)|nr:EAL domain-containing protein [Acidimicrobiales bacterium]